MKREEFKEKMLINTKIKLSNDDYIILREPTLIEMQNFSDDNRENLKLLAKIFKDCVIEHTFANEDGTKMANTEVQKTLETSGALFIEILNAWINNIPFSRRLQQK